MVEGEEKAVTDHESLCIRGITFETPLQEGQDVWLPYKRLGGNLVSANIGKVTAFHQYPEIPKNIHEARDLKPVQARTLVEVVLETEKGKEFNRAFNAASLYAAHCK